MKKVISWCIIFVLVFGYPFAARAALSNVVVGLQDGAGDVVELYGENLELILDARETALYNLNRVFAISIDAAGMWDAYKSALQNAYSYAADTTEDVLRAIGYLFGDWIHDADVLAGNVYESAAEHCYVSEDGKLYIDGDFVDYVDNFLQWLWSADGAGLIDYADEVITDPVYGYQGTPFYYPAMVGDAYIRVVENGVARAEYWAYSEDMYHSNSDPNRTNNLIKNTCGVFFQRISNSLLTLCLYNPSDVWKGQKSSSTVGNITTSYITSSRYNQSGIVYAVSGMSSSSYWLNPNIPIFSSAVNAESIEVISGGTQKVGNPDIFENLTSAEIDLSEYFDITASETPTTGDWTITPKQLVQAVAESIAGDQSEQQITAVDGSGAQTVVAATPTGAELQPVEGSPASGSSSFPTITVPSIEGNWNGVEGFQIDLSGVFPFCVPFDIYKLISKLSVDPVTPVFEIPVAVSERMGMYETVTVDLSPFDDFAASMRNLQKLLILAAVGVLSWKMIFGGD